MKIDLNGKNIAARIKGRLFEKIKELEKPLTLLIIQVGEDERSSVYIRQKVKIGESLGCNVVLKNFPSSIGQGDILEIINEANSNSEVDGILVQLPIPDSLDATEIIESIEPKKDVDGLHSKNRLALENGEAQMIPATALAVMHLLDENDVDVKDKKVLIIGRSELVGRPIEKLMKQNGANVTVAHSKTANTLELIQKADIIVSAVGLPGIVKTKDIKSGAIVIDVGITKGPDGISGDVEGDAILREDISVSPVPGGVGPMTVISLFENLLLSREISSID